MADRTGTDTTAETAPAIRGTTQSGMRAQNERLVLSLVRQHGALAKAELARMTGLSAQTMSVIMRALEEDGLLLRGAPVRGRVGQPSVPMHLAPDGALFFGLKIGRRSAEMVLVDFLGNVRDRTRSTYAYPMPEAILSIAAEARDRMTRRLKPGQRARISGLGVAFPFRLWDWARPLGLAPDAMADWRDFDLRAELEAALGLPVTLENDASAACGAELVFGQTGAGPDFLYFFVGFFIGGGLVLDRRLHTGASGNAAALGSMPVPVAGGDVVQLIDVASLCRLEHAVAKAGSDADAIWNDPEHWCVDRGLVDAWAGEAARGIAHAAAAAACVVDLPSVLIDGWMPRSLQADLVERSAAAIKDIDLAGATPPRILAGSVGPEARALGAACLPLSSRYLADTAA